MTKELELFPNQQTSTSSFTPQNQQNFTTSEPPPPPYTPGYTGSPIDETSGEYNDFINIPDHKILVIDKQYVTNKHIVYSLKKNKNNNDIIDIFDSEDYEEFQCKNEHQRMTIYGEDNKPILNTTVNAMNKKSIQILKGDSIIDTYATIETSSNVTDDIKNFKIIVFNKATNKNEELEMRYNKFRNYYSFYCNKGKDNETMIGAIKKIKTYPDRPAVSVEIAPLVDYMLLLGLGIIVLRFEEMKDKINSKKKAAIALPLSLLCTIS